MPGFPAPAGDCGKELSATATGASSAAAIITARQITASRFISSPQEWYFTCRQTKNQLQKRNLEYLPISSRQELSLRPRWRAGEAISKLKGTDCFVVSLFAMTRNVNFQA
jgi:hypothetical protein